MYIITTHKNSHNQKYDRTHSMMTPQSPNPLLAKESLSGLRELEIL